VLLLRAAGLPPEGGWRGFAVTGGGMGLTLMVAGERHAYVLSDIGTFLAFRERTGLVALTGPSAGLRNVYSVMRIDPERFERPVNAEGASRLADYLLSPEVQRRIGEFGVDRFGRPLFQPLSGAAPEVEPRP
jgi:tungstate transport system substrate-binding protein